MTTNLSWDDLPGYLQRPAGLARAAVRQGVGVLLVGPPGSEKIAIARRLVLDIGPSEAMLTVATNIHRRAGLLREDEVLERPPFRAPHHTAGLDGMFGSGIVSSTNVARVQLQACEFRPGEVSLAHGGILYLDDVGDYSQEVLWTLDVILRAGEIQIKQWYNRAPAGSYAAEPILVGGTQPCPCGLYDKCMCLDSDIVRHWRRLFAVLGHMPMIVRVPLAPEENP